MGELIGGAVNQAGAPETGPRDTAWGGEHCMVGRSRKSLGCALGLTSALSQEGRPSQKSERVGAGDGEAAMAEKPRWDVVFPGLSIS